MKKYDQFYAHGRIQDVTNKNNAMEKNVDVKYMEVVKGMDNLMEKIKM